MTTISCFDSIAECGLSVFDSRYTVIKNAQNFKDNPTALLLRSSSLHNIDLPESLQAIARAGAGVNNIPLEQCTNQGIAVFNTPGANANAVKEIVIASLLLASRDLIGGQAWCKEHTANADIAKEAERCKKHFAGCEIAGKTLGVVGLGAIGVLVANAAQALGMTVLGYDPYLSTQNALKLTKELHYMNTLEELFSKSDYISLHMPANAHTKGIVSKELIACMKPNCCLLNFSRDSLVDYGALKRALEANEARKYVCDFATPETINLPQTIIFPHLGASTQEAEDNCAFNAACQLKEYLEQGRVVNSVNFPACNIEDKPEETVRLIAIINKEAHREEELIQAHNRVENCHYRVVRSENDTLIYLVYDIAHDSNYEEFISELKRLSGLLRLREIA